MKIITAVFCLSISCFGFSTPPKLKQSTPALIPPGESVVSPPQQDPLTLLRELIQSTSQHLEQQKNLEKGILRFQESRKAYLTDTQDQQAAMRMVINAYSVLKIVQEQHLSQLMPPAFMKEISFFAKFAEKKPITSP